MTNCATRVMRNIMEMNMSSEPMLDRSDVTFRVELVDNGVLVVARTRVPPLLTVTKLIDFDDCNNQLFDELLRDYETALARWPE